MLKLIVPLFNILTYQFRIEGFGFCIVNDCYYIIVISSRYWLWYLHNRFLIQVIHSILCYEKVYENIAKVNGLTIEPSNDVVSKDLLVYLLYYMIKWQKIDDKNN